MPAVTVELPSLLSQLVGGKTTLTVEAESLQGALKALTEEHGILRVHLFDESGALRQHVLCFHNGTNTRWLDSDVPVGDGDTLTIMQAVSGG